MPTMLDTNFWIAFGLTTFAGLSTGIGSAIAFFAKTGNFRFLSWATGFSAGVMLYVSFVEIMPKALEVVGEVYDGNGAAWLTTLAFFGGIIMIFAIDQLVPHAENPHEARSKQDLAEVTMHHHGPGAETTPDPKSLERTGIFTALAVGIHNFPEGLVTFLAALQDPTLGVAIAIAIALHNIPEGISVSVPIYYATGERRKAFVWSLLSGLAEPAGALLGYIVLRPYLTPGLMGIMFAGVAGIMVYISLDELLPTSRAYGRGHDSLYGLLGGMAVMALSLLLLA
jgi:zinc transporter, ZIP family